MFKGTFPGLTKLLWDLTLSPKSFTVPALRDHLLKGFLPINLIEIWNLFLYCQFDLPEFPLSFRMVLRFRSLIVLDVGGASHFSLVMYTVFCPRPSSFLLVFSPSHDIHRLGFGPLKYSHGGLIYRRNYSKLLCNLP